jgi:formylglycine-generating enzyme required for sulfatase activity
MNRPGPAALATLAILLLTPRQLSAQQSPTANPPSETQLLKTFTQELVHIQPGTDKFPGGKVTLGTDNPSNELPKTTVEINSPFRIARYETTQELYQLVMGNNPSRWKGPRNSVEMMTIADAQTFCDKLTQKLHQQQLIPPTESVRLPTESEWEYCCRAGTDTRYSFGDSATAPGDKDPKASKLDPYAWHTGNAAGNDPPVGALKPNPWGLFDMHGYLSEFVTPDPRLPDVPKRSVVLRSGSWKDLHSRLTSSARQILPDTTADDALGFRCVVAPQATAKP